MHIRSTFWAVYDTAGVHHRPLQRTAYHSYHGVEDSDVARLATRNGTTLAELNADHGSPCLYFANAKRCHPVRAILDAKRAHRMLLLFFVGKYATEDPQHQ